MPLASLSNLQWNGPASFAMVDTSTATDELTLSAFNRVPIVVTSTATDQIRATILKGLFLTVLAAATDSITGARAKARVALLVDVAAQPTASDIAQAVWGASTAINATDGTMARAMKLMSSIAANRVVTDPTAGTYTVYDDDNTTVLASGDLWQDADGTTPYAGAGAERRDRLT
jgi:hypothetical protein